MLCALCFSNSKVSWWRKPNATAAAVAAATTTEIRNSNAWFYHCYPPVSFGFDWFDNGLGQGVLLPTTVFPLSGPLWRGWWEQSRNAPDAPELQKAST